MLELSDNIYNSSLSRDEPKFKLWNEAGLLLTYKCNAACEFCYYNCDPHKAGLMPVEMAVGAWEGLVRIAGPRAKVHFTGGEPFLYYDHLIEILETARRAGLPEPDMVETNGFWATDDEIARERLVQLKSLGLKRFKISTDPFHRPFVDVEPVKRLARIAEEVLGSRSVLVRWRKYLEDGPTDEGNELEQRYLETLADYPCRFTGRAAGMLADLVIRNSLVILSEAKDLASEEQLRTAPSTITELRTENCRSDLLGAKHIHIDPFGNVFSGTCSGIIVARIAAGPAAVAEVKYKKSKGKTLESRRAGMDSHSSITGFPLDGVWKEFDPRANPLLRVLFEHGPAGLLDLAVASGYEVRAHYADKCHLCTDIRTFLQNHGLETTTIGPAQCYP